jgi:hypothetical protein
VADSPDSYYQEVGRAGRDGEPALAVLFYRPEDLGLRRFFASGLPHQDDLERVAAAVRSASGPLPVGDLRDEAGVGPTRLAGLLNLLEQVGAVEPAGPGAVEAPPDGDPPDQAAIRALGVAEARQRLERSRVEMMRGYAETTGCRRQFLLGYFGEPYDPPCGACDVCLSGEEVVGTPGTGEQDFPVNAEVVHVEWGDGLVMSHDGDAVVVLFEAVGYKTLSVPAVLEKQLLLRR